MRKGSALMELGSREEALICFERAAEIAALQSGISRATWRRLKPDRAPMPEKMMEFQSTE